MSSEAVPVWLWVTASLLFGFVFLFFWFSCLGGGGGTKSSHEDRILVKGCLLRVMGKNIKLMSSEAVPVWVTASLLFGLVFLIVWFVCLGGGRGQNHYMKIASW